MSHSSSQMSNSTSHQVSRGLLIIGCQPACGKTAVMTGLAATLHQEGLPVKAIKPICLSKDQFTQAELNFIATISHSALNYPVQFVGSHGLLSTFQWNEMLRLCRSGTEVCLIELPSPPATALNQENGRWRDVADLAAEINWPCILVSAAGPNCLEKLILNAHYLAQHKIEVIGLVTVETENPHKPNSHLQRNTSTIDSLEIVLPQRTGIPFLGCLTFSRSINVHEVSQGNLIKTTSTCLDLLPIIKALNLPTPV